MIRLISILTKSLRFSIKKRFRGRNKDDLLFFLTDLGPTFIKLGQIIALRPDVFGSETSEELFDLLDSTPYIDDIEVVIQEALRSIDINKTFQNISKKPIGSASLAQVHTAIYKGKPVAIKVLKPNVRELVKKDLKFLKFLAWLLKWLPQYNQHTMIIEDFIMWTTYELDYEIELRNMIEYRENAIHSDLKVPSLYPEVSNKDILVQEYIQGQSLADMIRGDTDTPEQLGKNLLEQILKTFLQLHSL